MDRKNSQQNRYRWGASVLLEGYSARRRTAEGTSPAVKAATTFVAAASRTACPRPPPAPPLSPPASSPHHDVIRRNGVGILSGVGGILSSSSSLLFGGNTGLGRGGGGSSLGISKLLRNYYTSTNVGAGNKKLPKKSCISVKTSSPTIRKHTPYRQGGGGGGGGCFPHRPQVLKTMIKSFKRTLSPKRGRGRRGSTGDKHKDKGGGGDVGTDAKNGPATSDGGGGDGGGGAWVVVTKNKENGEAAATAKSVVTTTGGDPPPEQRRTTMTTMAAAEAAPATTAEDDDFGRRESSISYSSSHNDGGATGTERSHVSSSAESQYLPLSGASVYVLTDHYGHDSTQSSSLSSQTENVNTAIVALGGEVLPWAEGATHALFIPPPPPTSQPPNQQQQQQRQQQSSSSGLSPYLESILTQCQMKGLPIVDASWLERMSGLNSDEHWSDIDVGPYVPPVLALINDQPPLEHRQDSRGRPPLSTNNSGVGGGGGGGGGGGAGAGGFLDGIRRNVFGAVGGSTSSGGGFGSRRQMSRDAQPQMTASISQTYQYLAREAPDILEEDVLRRAIELSMLDWALVQRKPTSSSTSSSSAETSFSMSSFRKKKKREKTPHEILGVKRNATVHEIKTAYKALARKTHPDKGGTSDEFHAVARAYRTLLNIGVNVDDGQDEEPINERSNKIKDTAHWDSELRDHRRLVEELFLNDGGGAEVHIEKQRQALQRLGLEPREAGSVNVNEKNEQIRNSCFYLSLSTSYLQGIGALMNTDPQYPDRSLQKVDDALIGETALQFKRLIEAAVVAAHPEWVQRGMVGEEVQAFSDFLVYTLDSPTVLSDLSVVVFDSVSGFVDVYMGKHYTGLAHKKQHQQQRGSDGADGGDDDDAMYIDDDFNAGGDATRATTRVGGGGGGVESGISGGTNNVTTTTTTTTGWGRSNTITVRYTPGHYQPLLPSTIVSSNACGGENNTITRPSLEEVLKVLDENGVLYVVTDGSA